MKKAMKKAKKKMRRKDKSDSDSSSSSDDDNRRRAAPDQRLIASISQLLPKLKEDASNFRELKQALREQAENESWPKYIFDPNATIFSPSTVKEKDSETRSRREAYLVILNTIPEKLRPNLDVVRNGLIHADAQALWRKIVELWSPAVRQGEYRTVLRKLLEVSMKTTCSEKNVTEYGATIVKMCNELSDMNQPQSVRNQQEIFLLGLIDELKTEGDQILEKVIKKDPEFETMAQVCAHMESYASRHGVRELTFKGQKSVGQNVAAVPKEQLDNNEDGTVVAKKQIHSKGHQSVECKWGNHCFSKTCGSKHPKGHTTTEAYQLVLKKFNGPCDKCKQPFHSTQNHGKQVCLKCAKIGHSEKDCDQDQEDGAKKVVLEKKMQNHQDVVITRNPKTSSQFNTRFTAGLSMDGCNPPIYLF
jgi:hypothetical protein